MTKQPVDATTSWSMPISHGFAHFRIYTCREVRESIPDAGGVTARVEQVTEEYDDDKCAVFFGVYGVAGLEMEDLEPGMTEHLFYRDTLESAVLTLRRMIGPVRFHRTGHIREWMAL